MNEDPNGVAPKAPWLWLLGSAIWLTASPSFSAAEAESLPASVRSCAGETDPNRRLACFDREVAHFTQTLPPADNRRDASAECCANAGTRETHDDSKSSAVPDSVAEDRFGLGDDPGKTKNGSTPKETRRLTAHVVSIEHWQGEIVVHLDNGQVWEQVQEASADMNLRPGDAITIDKGVLGAFWLGGRSEGVIKVKRRK